MSSLPNPMSRAEVPKRTYNQMMELAKRWMKLHGNMKGQVGGWIYRTYDSGASWTVVCQGYRALYDRYTGSIEACARDGLIKLPPRLRS